MTKLFKDLAFLPQLAEASVVITTHINVSLYPALLPSFFYWENIPLNKVPEYISISEFVCCRIWPELCQHFQWRMDRAFKSLMIFINGHPSFCLFLVMVPLCNYPPAHLRDPLSLGMSCESTWKWLLFLCHARMWEPTSQSLAMYAQVHCAAILILSIFFTLLSAFPLVLVIPEALLGRPIAPYQEDQPIPVFSLLPVGSPFSPCPGRRFQLLGEGCWWRNLVLKPSEWLQSAFLLT